MFVAAEAMDLRLGAHIPHPGDGIASGRHEDIERRMEFEGIDT